MRIQGTFGNEKETGVRPEIDCRGGEILITAIATKSLAKSMQSREHLLLQSQFTH